jgi:hypothetical protein
MHGATAGFLFVEPISPAETVPQTSKIIAIDFSESDDIGSADLSRSNVNKNSSTGAVR